MNNVAAQSARVGHAFVPDVGIVGFVFGQSTVTVSAAASTDPDVERHSAARLVRRI